MDELERWGVPLHQPASRAAKSPTREEISTSIQTESRQKLWKWFLVAVLALLLVECALAGATAVRTA
jgi:hypothetical protein